MMKTEKNSPAVLVNSLRENTIAKTFIAGNGVDSLRIYISKYINPDKAFVDDVTIYLSTIVGAMDYGTILDCISLPKVKEYLDEVMPNEVSEEYKLWSVKKISPYRKDYHFITVGYTIRIDVFRSWSSIGPPPYPFMITVRMSSKKANRKVLMQCLTNECFRDYVSRLIKKTYRPRREDLL